MAYRYGSRHQKLLLPTSVEEFVPLDAPVRAYDAFVESLDLEELGIEAKHSGPGNSPYSPRSMLKLLIYGLSYGVRSSRKLERACHDNLSFIWLMGDLKPDHKTISEFRRKHKKTLQIVFRKCVAVCVELNLIAGNVLFVDGSKFRGNAGIAKNWTREKLEKKKTELEAKIEKLLYECEEEDKAEEGEASHARIDRKLTKAGAMQSKINSALARMDEVEKKRTAAGQHEARDKRRKPTVNVTDPSTVKAKSRQGTHPVHNVQAVTDNEHGLIAGISIADAENDVHEYARQIELAQNNIGSKCAIAVADSGYCKVEELEKIEAQETTVIVPSRAQASGKSPGPFDKQSFYYDAEEDVYICPEGNRLKLISAEASGSRKYCGGEACLKCRQFGKGKCTVGRKGRIIRRHPKEESMRRFEAEYAKADNQGIYKHRKERAELPFGHMKMNLGAGQFLLRGRASAHAEASVLATCFNLARMITILGVTGVMQALL